MGPSPRSRSPAPSALPPPFAQQLLRFRSPRRWADNQVHAACFEQVTVLLRDPVVAAACSSTRMVKSRAGNSALRLDKAKDAQGNRSKPASKPSTTIGRLRCKKPMGVTQILSHLFQGPPRSLPSENPLSAAGCATRELQRFVLLSFSLSLRLRCFKPMKTPSPAIGRAMPAPYCEQVLLLAAEDCAQELNGQHNHRHTDQVVLQVFQSFPSSSTWAAAHPG